MWNLRVWQIRVLAIVACVLLPFAVSAQVSQDQFDRTSLFRNLLEASYCIGTIDRKLEQTNVCSNLQRRVTKMRA